MSESEREWSESRLCVEEALQPAGWLSTDPVILIWTISLRLWNNSTITR